MASEVQVEELTKGISKFASEFYQESSKTAPGDIIVSPLSVASALAVLSQGANGNTFEELRRGLHLNADKSVTANQFHELDGLLQEAVGQSTLSIANHIYVQSGYNINQNFQEVAEKKFMSGIGAMDFDKSAPSAKTINDFVEEKTNGKVKDLIKPAMLNSLTRLVFVNAIYFKGSWKHKFNKKRTRTGDFFVSERNSVQVDFMTIRKKFKYGTLDNLDATALEMEYANSNLSFVIILPNSRTGLASLESKLNNYDLAKITRKMYLQEVSVRIPKFKSEFEIDLKNILPKMGMGEMFSQEADLGGLLDPPLELFVAHAVHKAFIEVNEEGSEAAAATSVVVQERSLPDFQSFRADHPFLYHIFDTTSETVLFSGRKSQ